MRLLFAIRERGRTRWHGFKTRLYSISGGARGQGAAEARLLVAEGAKVVIGDVLDAEGRRLAERTR